MEPSTSSTAPQKNNKVINIVTSPLVKNITRAKLPQYIKLAPIPRCYPERPQSGKQTYCYLCKKNCEPSEVYSSHTVKSRDGRVTCPVLRKHICELCGATGDYAHTKTHCPSYQNKENICAENKMPLFRILSNGKSTSMLHHK